MRAVAAVTAPLNDPRENQPPRSLWLRRWLFAALLVWLVLAATWLVLLRAADAQLDAEVRAARLRREPVTIADFAKAPIPQEQNRVFHLLRANENYRENDQESGENWEMLHSYPLSPEAASLLRPYVRANAPALAALRAMRICRDADWELFNPADSPIDRQRKVMEQWPSLNMLREMGYLLIAACMLAHHDGDDAAAVEYLRDVLAVARTGDEAPVLVPHLVSISIEAMAAAAVKDLAPSLDSPARGGSSATTRPADRAAVAALVRELLEEEQRIERARRAFLGERALAISFAGERRFRLAVNRGAVAVVPVSSYRRAVDMLCRPLRRRRAAEDVIALGRASIAQHYPDAPSAAARMPPPRPRASSSISLLEWMNSDAGSGFDRAVESQYRVAVIRRLSATLLALRLYQLDHADRVPAKLQELVGKYLPAVPSDPFATGAQSIGYLRRGQAAFVYSVFSNGRDDMVGGWLPTAADCDRWDRPDFVLVFDAAASATTPPTSSPLR